MLKKILCAIILTALISCSFSIVSHGTSTSVKAPGGNVSNYDELIAALGGGDGLALQDDRLVIVKDIILENPVVIMNGSYTLVGEGATVSAGFEIGDLFVVRGEDSALILGDKSQTEEKNDLVFDGRSDKISRQGSLFRTENGAALKLYRSVKLCNSITTASGGAIYNGGNFVMYGGEIQNCKAALSGGAVYNSSDAVFASGSIENCSANDGGIVYNEGKASFAGTELSGGFALNGGAVYNGSEIQFLSSVITDCTASKGGAIYNEGTLTVSGGSISACGSDTCDGGGIYNAGALNISGSALRENSAENGGNIYNTGTVTAKDSAYINGGKAIKCGGNIYNAKNAVIDFSSGMITLGKAKYGGGIYNLGEVDLSGGAVNANIAEVAEGILNHGIMNLSKYGYCGDNDDIFVVLTDEGKHAVRVSSDWSFDKKAVELSCGIYANGTYSYEYNEKDRLLDLEGEIDVSKRFALFKTGLGLVLSDNGTLTKAPAVSVEVIVYLLVAIVSFAAVVFAMVFIIRYFDKKKLTR